MPVTSMLDGFELQQVQKIAAEDNEAVTRHRVPGLEGDFLQDLGRRATRIVLNGVLTGSTVADNLKQLPEKFQKTQAIPFQSDRGGQRGSNDGRIRRKEGSRGTNDAHHHHPANGSADCRYVCRALLV